MQLGKSPVYVGGRVPHASHSLLYTRGVTFCSHCGAYGSERVSKLGTKCLAPTTAGELVLKRIAEGKHPRYNGEWPKPDEIGIGQYALATTVPYPKAPVPRPPKSQEDSD